MDALHATICAGVARPIDRGAIKFTDQPKGAQLRATLLALTPERGVKKISSGVRRWNIDSDFGRDLMSKFFEVFFVRDRAASRRLIVGLSSNAFPLCCVSFLTQDSE